MAFVNSLRVLVQKESPGRFIVWVDGRRVATCDTEEEEATRVAAAEGTRIEGF